MCGRLCCVQREHWGDQPRSSSFPLFGLLKRLGETSDSMAVLKQLDFFHGSSSKGQKQKLLSKIKREGWFFVVSRFPEHKQVGGFLIISVFHEYRFQKISVLSLQRLLMASAWNWQSFCHILLFKAVTGPAQIQAESITQAHGYWGLSQASKIQSLIESEPWTGCIQNGVLLAYPGWQLPLSGGITVCIYIGKCRKKSINISDLSDWRLEGCDFPSFSEALINTVSCLAFIPTFSGILLLVIVPKQNLGIHPI